MKLELSFSGLCEWLEYQFDIAALYVVYHWSQRAYTLLNCAIHTSFYKSVHECGAIEKIN